MKKYLFVSIILCLLLAICTGASLTSFAEGGFAMTSYNYAKEGDDSYKTIDTVGILENLLGESLGESEKAFLNENGNLFLNYSSDLNISFITTELNDNELYVSADPYRYKAENGSDVVWTPVDVSGRPLEYVDDSYTYTFEDVDNELLDDSVTVKYESLFELRYSDINKYLNYAYNEGKSAYERLEQKRIEYENAEKAYQENTIKYNQYLIDYAQFENDNAKYQAYLIQYKLWQDKVNAYNRYLQECETYQIELDLFIHYDENLKKYNRDYQLYMEYLSLQDIYEKNLVIFNEYSQSEDIQTAAYQVAMLHYMTRKCTDLQRTLLSAILGDKVIQVLERKEELVTIGVEKRAVDVATNASYALKRLLKQYQTYNNDNDRYSFYITCYEELKKNFLDLYRCLDYIFHNYAVIRKYIYNVYDRGTEFEILLAQLWNICTALTNEKIPNYTLYYKGANASGAGYLDGDYKVGDLKKTVEEVLGEYGMFENLHNPIPLENGVPYLPEVPIKPRVYEKPVPPIKVSEPVEPFPVAPPPAEPKRVVQPIEPTEVNEPLEPQQYVPTADEIELSRAYENGEFEQRKLYKANQFYKAEVSIQKFFRNASIVTVHFCEKAGDKKAMYVIPEVKLGEAIEFPLDYPKKNRTGYTCTFDYWVDEYDNQVDLNNFVINRGDVFLYPHYKEIPNMYPLSWRIDSTTTYSDECAYDSSPVYDTRKFGEITKEKMGLRQYRFVGWKSGDNYYPTGTPLAIMTDQSITYEAVFEESLIVTWVVSGFGTSTSVWKGDMPVYKSIPTKEMDNFYVYTFAGWDKPVVEAEEDTTYTAVFNKSYLISFSSISSVSGGMVSFKEDYYVADCRTSNSFDYVVVNLFNVAGSQGKGVEVELPSTILRFSPPTVNDLATAGVVSMTISAVSLSNYKYRYTLIAYNGNKEIILIDGSDVEVTAYGSFDTEDSYLVETTADNVVRDVRFKIKDNEITFNMNVGSKYLLSPMYLVSIISSEFVNIKVSNNRATNGETITVTPSDAPNGMFIESIYLVREDGEEIKVDENSSFVMPKCGVRVGVVCGYYEYTVTFKSDGKNISIRTYRYGDTVSIPSDPYKPADEKYIYKFNGWDSEVIDVEGDAVYNAVFTSSPLVDESKNLPKTKIAKLLRIAYVVVPILAVLFIGLIVLTVVLVIRKRKREVAVEPDSEENDVE